MSMPATGMHSGSAAQPSRHWRTLRDPELRVALVVAVCLLGQAVIAKNVLDVTLDPITSLGALWVWLVYSLTGRRDRVSELGAEAAAVFVTAATLVLYAL